MEIDFIPRGVCASKITIDIDDGIIENVKIIGGCAGNSQGVSMLAKGMKVQEVIDRLEGIHCGRKSTSCPDQLAKALKETCR